MLLNIKDLIGKSARECSPSPFGQWLNGTVIEAEKGKVTVEYLVRNEFANPANIMHGGAIAGIIDEVMGITSFSLERDYIFVAINLNIDFLRPGIVGQKITVISEIIREGKTLIHGECKVYNEENKIVAKATQNLTIISKR